MIIVKRVVSMGALSPLLVLAVWWIATSVGSAAPLPQAMAPACFTETGYCIDGRIRELWERGGGLMVFGFPITGLQPEVIEGRTVMLQWFERARIELHPELPYPYDALIGRVGAEALARRAPMRAVASTAMVGECRAFAETGLSVCGEFLAPGSPAARIWTVMARCAKARAWLCTVCRSRRPAPSNCPMGPLTSYSGSSARASSCTRRLPRRWCCAGSSDAKPSR